MEFVCIRLSISMQRSTHVSQGAYGSLHAFSAVVRTTLTPRVDAAFDGNLSSLKRTDTPGSTGEREWWAALAAVGRSASSLLGSRRSPTASPATSPTASPTASLRRESRDLAAASRLLDNTQLDATRQHWEAAGVPAGRKMSAKVIV